MTLTRMRLLSCIKTKFQLTRHPSIGMCSLKGLMEEDNKFEKKPLLYYDLIDINPHPDWSYLKAKINKKFHGDGFFEISVMSCLITFYARDEHVEDVKDKCKSFLEFLDGKTFNKPLFHLHYACILSILDAKKHKDTIVQTLFTIHANNKNHSKYPPFSIALYNVAAISKEDCEKVFDFALKNEESLATGIIVRLRKLSIDYGLIDSLPAKTKKTGLSSNEVDKWANVFSDPTKVDTLTEESLLNFLKAMNLNALSFNQSHRDKVLKIFDRRGYEFQRVTINVTECSRCHRTLETFDQQEIKAMKNAFFENVVKRHSSLFTTTTPAEFNSFVEATTSKEFGFVVDSLNAAYQVPHERVMVATDRRKYQNLDSKIVNVPMKLRQEEIVTSLIEMLVDRYPPVFLIGRDFVRNWRRLWQFAHDNSDKLTLFPLHSMSRDDLFLIYAALNSANTFILTNDFFRDHIAKMDDPLFARWVNNRLVKISQQMTLPKMFLSEVKVNIHNESSFHLPFTTSNSLPYAQWYCVHKKKSEG